MFSSPSSLAVPLFTPFKPKAAHIPEPLWKYVAENASFAKGGSKKWSCSFCKLHFAGSYPRVRAHLLDIKNQGIQVCCKVSAEERASLTKEDHESAAKKQKSSSDYFNKKRATQPSVECLFKNASREEVDEATARCFYACGLPFVLARSLYFQDMVSAIASFGDFWEKVEKYVKILWPVMAMLRVVDRDQPIMGVVYEAIDQMLEQIKEILIEDTDGALMYEEIRELAQERWDMLHSPLHATTFLLNPILFSKKPYKDKEVVKGWRKTLDRVNRDEAEKTSLKAQLSDYISLQGEFEDISAFGDMQKLSPIAWWQNYGPCKAWDVLEDGSSWDASFEHEDEDDEMFPSGGSLEDLDSSVVFAEDFQYLRLPPLQYDTQAPTYSLTRSERNRVIRQEIWHTYIQRTRVDPGHELPSKMLHYREHFLQLSEQGFIEIPLYMQRYMPHHLQVVIGQLRVSSHQLEIERDRAKGLPRDERICPICHTEVESEEHFMVKAQLTQHSEFSLV
ncbi:hypothetical protein L7F22_002449 [Adiantum nelumboides]|nr:hypothetical protein [Adiantum nelumboides]